MESELRHETIRFSVNADNLHFVRESQRRFEQSVNHELRQRIGHSDHEPQRASGGPVFERVLQFASERKNLVRIAIHRLAGLGQHQVPSRLLEEGRLQGLLQRANLSADGGLS